MAGTKNVYPKRNEAVQTTFEEAARALECDESEQRFNEALGKIVRHKPKPDKPPEKASKTEDKKPAK